MVKKYYRFHSDALKKDILFSTKDDTILKVVNVGKSGKSPSSLIGSIYRNTPIMKDKLTAVTPPLYNSTELTTELTRYLIATLKVYGKDDHVYWVRRFHDEWSAPGISFATDPSDIEVTWIEFNSALYTDIEILSTKKWVKKFFKKLDIPFNKATFNEYMNE